MPSAKGAASVKRAAAFRADEHYRLIAGAKAAGAKTAEDVARELNKAGHRTALGKTWTAGNVYQVERKIRARRAAVIPRPAPVAPPKPPSLIARAG
jgi:hypothetical protein